MPEGARKLARRRTVIGLIIFAAAALTAPVLPLLGFALICCALLLYLRPEIFSRQEE